MAFTKGCYTTENVLLQLYHDSLVLLYVAQVEKEEKNGTANLPAIQINCGMIPAISAHLWPCFRHYGRASDYLLSHGCREAVGSLLLSAAGLAASSALEVAGKGLCELRRTWVGP